jgi:hypothetical protein
MSKVLQEMTDLRAEVERLRALEARNAASAGPAAVEIDLEQRSHMIAVAQNGALRAARETLGNYGPVIVLEHMLHESLADTVLYVVAEEPTTSEEQIAAEKAFYTALRERMPDDLTPVVDVILRFETRQK